MKSALRLVIDTDLHSPTTLDSFSPGRSLLSWGHQLYNFLSTCVSKCALRLHVQLYFKTSLVKI